MKYARGSYNKFNDEEQWIRISEGCPNNCGYCRETKECGKNPIYFEIPKIVRNTVKIMDMNLLYKPKAIEIIKELGSRKVKNKVVYYELVCGIDWRYLTQEKADLLKKNRFKNIRFAWDSVFKHQVKIKDCILSLKKAGYKSRKISCFIICNWDITFSDCMRKLDLLKVWNVKVNDCWFDSQISPNIQPVHWKIDEIKVFRKRCRKHNQMVTFGIDPEYKEGDIRTPYFI